MDTKEYEHGMQGGESADDNPVTENIYGQDVKTVQAADITYTFEKQRVEREERVAAPRNPVTAGESFPTPVDDGFESNAENFEPVSKPKSKPTSTKKVVIIVVIAVVVMGLLAAAFAAFVLPRITGESNPVSDLISGTKKPDNTPGDVVAAFDKAFNENDRDTMANCFLPSQSLKRNVEGGAVQVLTGILGYFGSDNITAHFKLESLTYDENDSTKATGRVKLSYTLPILGDMTKDLSATFKLENNKWYFDDFLNGI